MPAWVFTGELVAALTRIGKMPVIYETIGMYGGMARIEQYKNGAVAFHENMTVPPMAPGVPGAEYITRVGAMLLRVDADERAKLDKAGAWAREAKAAGKQLFMYSMGHLFPDEVAKTDIGKTFKSAAWNAGFRTPPAPNDAYQPGDLAVLIGYQPPAIELVKRTRAAGARAVYVTVMGHRDDLESNDAIWIDPMWDWQDACVPITNYDVPMLPASGIVNGAIAWEIYRLATTAD